MKRITKHAKVFKILAAQTSNSRSLAQLKSSLTPKRLVLWSLVRDAKPESITELSKLVSRTFKSVQRDLEVLAQCELIEFEEKHGTYGSYQKPYTLVDRIEVEVR